MRHALGAAAIAPSPAAVAADDKSDRADPLAAHCTPRNDRPAPVGPDQGDTRDG